MDDTIAAEKRAALDAALSGVPANVGIAFGMVIFNEFARRNWFTLENFGVFGTQLFGSKVPAYNRTHFVFATWDVDDENFKVGSAPLTLSATP